MTDARWIVVRNWDRFQHYKDREPPWIKDYTEQLDDPAYLELTGIQRAALQGIRLKYAASRRQVLNDTALLSRQLNMRITRETLDALNHAGFIEFSASKPLADCKQNASVPRAREEQDAMHKDLQSSSTSTQDREDLPFEKELAATRLLAAIGATNGTTREALERYELPPAAWYAAAEELEHKAGVRNRAGYVVTMFRTWKQEGRYT